MPGERDNSFSHTPLFGSSNPFLEANIYVTKYHQILQFYIEILQVISWFTICLFFLLLKLPLSWYGHSVKWAIWLSWVISQTCQADMLFVLSINPVPPRLPETTDKRYLIYPAVWGIRRDHQRANGTAQHISASSCVFHFLLFSCCVRQKTIRSYGTLPRTFQSIEYQMNPPQVPFFPRILWVLPAALCARAYALNKNKGLNTNARNHACQWAKVEHPTEVLGGIRGQSPLQSPQ
jgi:hypothetical protein